MSRSLIVFAIMISLTAHVVFMDWPLWHKKMTAEDLAALQQLAAVMELVEVMEEVEPEKEVVEEEPEPEEIVEPEPEPEPVIEEPEPEPEPEVEEVKPEEIPEPLPPQIEEMFEKQAVETEVEEQGDFAQSQEGIKRPVLRINWGDQGEALKTLKSGGMRLVVYEGEDKPIDKEYVFRSGAWRLQRLNVNRMERFSNRLRIVKDVPAFMVIVNQRGWVEENELAVMLPREIERMLEEAQLSAASGQGLSLSEIHSFAGEFNLESKNLSFEVTAIRVRTK